MPLYNTIINTIILVIGILAYVHSTGEQTEKIERPNSTIILVVSAQPSECSFRNHSGGNSYKFTL